MIRPSTSLCPIGVHWALLLLMLLLGTASPEAVPAASRTADGQALAKAIGAEWGGHLKLRGSASWPEPDSLLGDSGKEVLYDGSAEGRLKTTLFFDDWWRFDCHYEIVQSGGDTRRERNRLGLPAAGPRPEVFTAERIPSDRQRLFDLTHVISEDDNDVLYHRLDRMVMTIRSTWGTVRLGRQAVTWGNGFLFNPMDLFNPFAPTDIEREYKIGDDLALLQVPVADTGNLQILAVPRRDRETGDVAADASALAAKLHWMWQTLEFDLMAAANYGDRVFGVGALGYLGGAAWRTDATWTVVDADLSADNYLSLTANIDYSWVGWGKNFYGFLEFFYSGIGASDYRRIFTDEALIERLVRGDLFVVGRPYLSGMLQIELNPLCNLWLTSINNLSDPSGILQPRLVYDVVPDAQILVGGTITYGGSETEFGGFRLPGTDLTTAAPPAVFVWLSYYF